MTDEVRLAKNKQISDSKRATKTKRETQVCKVFTVKIDIDKLSKTQQEQIKMMFVELKWLRNDMIRWSKDTTAPIWKYDNLTRKITRKDKDFNDIETELKFVPTQVSQDFVIKTIANIRGLATKKKQGHKIGPLKFVKEINSIPLRQFNKTHKILSSKKVKITGISGKITVNGLKQFYDKKPDIANAVLIQNALGYYIKFTTYFNKETQPTKKLKNPIGIDFGCSTSFTTSDGEKINIQVQESERLKTLQRRFAKCKKGSKRRIQILSLIKKEYLKMTNKKIDLANKAAASFLEHSFIAIQNEQLANWQKNSHGKKVQHSVLGRVKQKLIKDKKTVVIHKFMPTTKLCCRCGKIHSIGYDSTFECCGTKEQRDIHAAKNILFLALNNVGTDGTEFKRVDCIRKLMDIINDSSVNLL